MIRNAVIHLLSEQPVIADLFAMPSPGDVTLLCTNLRTRDGRQPVFVDRTASTFVFPYLHIRFVEIYPEVSTETADEAAGEAAVPAEPDLEIDEDFLRRIREA